MKTFGIIDINRKGQIFTYVKFALMYGVKISGRGKISNGRSSLTKFSGIRSSL